MADIQWIQNVIYGNTGNGLLTSGSIHISDDDGSSLEVLANANGAGIVGGVSIGSIEIAQGTVLTPDSTIPNTITVTLNFQNGQPLYDVTNNTSFQSVQVQLRWAGYQTYTPSSSSGSENALEFTVRSVGAGTTTDGEVVALSSVTSSQLLTDLQNLAGRLALLPTYEPSVLGAAQNLTAVNSTIPSIKVCFLEGAEIKTPDGVKCVENIVAGDVIIAVIEGNEIATNVVAVCKNVITVHSGKDWPVCIKKNALQDGVPYKDLYVTEEHCLLIDGKFIPSRMLVNKTSIVKSECETRQYHTYHIECEKHAVIVANGVLTESYLDTSHTISENVILLGEKNWRNNAAAPLCTDSHIIRNINEGLRVRAHMLGFEEETLDHIDYTNDPDFHVETERGRKVFPCKVSGGDYFFLLPKTVSSLSLISRTFVPAEVEGPHIDDRRELGVLVGNVSFFKNDMKEVFVFAHQRKDSLAGWYTREFDRFRWTSAKAVLPLTEIWGDLSSSSENTIIFKIEVLKKSKYKINNYKLKILEKIS